MYKRVPNSNFEKQNIAFLNDLFATYSVFSNGIWVYYVHIVIKNYYMLDAEGIMFSGLLPFISLQYLNFLTYD